MNGFIHEIKDIGKGLLKLFSFKIVILFQLFVILTGLLTPSFGEFDIKYNFSVIDMSPRFNILGVQLTGSVSIGGTDSILYEGCGVATIEMMRPGDITLGDTVHFIIVLLIQVLRFLYYS